MIWTPETVGHLCRRYRDGALHSEIAAEIGTTKNACIGKFRRLLSHSALAQSAFDARNGTRMDEVADWMAAHGGSIADCARSLDIHYDAARAAWNRIRQKLGEQAA